MQDKQPRIGPLMCIRIVRSACINQSCVGPYIQSSERCTAYVVFALNGPFDDNELRHDGTRVNQKHIPVFVVITQRCAECG